MEINIELLSELCSIEGPSGREIGISRKVQEELKKSCDKVLIDAFYNVFGYINGKSVNPKTVVITAHQDQIGLMVKKVEENGFLRFTKISGIDPKILPSQQIVIHGERDIDGIIGSTPPHLAVDEDKKKKPDFDELYIDTGLTTEQVKAIIRVGDTITFKPNACLLASGKMFTSSSLDDRSCVYALIELAAIFKNNRPENNLVFLSASGEETFSIGATVGGNLLQPDVAIVLDVTFGRTPGLDVDKTFKCGEGPVITIAPILDKRVTGKLLEICNSKNIKFQLEADGKGNGSDAWALQVCQKGIPCAQITLPLKYMHTAVETINLDDLTTTINIVEEFCNLQQNEMEVMLCWKH